LVAVLVITSSLAGGAPPPAAAATPPLRYLGGPARSLDPAHIADAGDVQLMLQLYAGLTRLDEAGEPYASLAESWDVSADGLTYTFHLRRGLTFSDDAPLSAADVRRSWLRLLDPATGASAPDVLSIVVGARERLAGAPESAVGISAPDERTLVVRLRQPAGYFPSITATPATFVVPPTARATDDWQTPTAFVGSGPYVVARQDGADLLLRANERYVAGTPPIGELRWVASIDGDPVTAFANDQLDLVQVSSADAGWMAYDPQLGRRLHRSAAMTVQYLGFDTTRPPFDDARVRRAFALALDRRRLVQLSQGTSAVPAGSLVPPALQQAGSALADPPPSADVGQAQQLLAQAGYADRSKLGTVTVDSTALDAAPIVATWRSVLGVKVSVETMDFNDYLDALDHHPPQVFTVNWIADYPSPHALYSLLLAGGAASNYGRWHDDRFDELLNAAGKAEDPAAQAAAYAAVDARVDEQAPLIPWSYEAGWWLARDGLTGLGSLTTGLLDFGRVGWQR
ncbi:MAG TPA: peptide ABC transporter substrate-binding protein, partial [Candidatus Limnocylindria bacterium]|nr:peptide ABC transporter substrate-binding protein [Candidatus Limnocylindria bacterium]